MSSASQEAWLKEYCGMEYPLKELPTIWVKLCEELRANAKESEADDPELAMRFRHRAISINACAEQLTWSLAHSAAIQEGELLKRLIRYIRACVEEISKEPMTRVNVSMWSQLKGALEEAESLIDGPKE